MDLVSKIVFWMSCDTTCEDWRVVVQAVHEILISATQMSLGLKGVQVVM